jgi:hypothetical protein
VNWLDYVLLKSLPRFEFWRISSILTCQTSCIWQEERQEGTECSRSTRGTSSCNRTLCIEEELIVLAMTCQMIHFVNKWRRMIACVLLHICTHKEDESDVYMYAYVCTQKLINVHRERGIKNSNSLYTWEKHITYTIGAAWPLNVLRRLLSELVRLCSCEVSPHIRILMYAFSPFLPCPLLNASEKGCSR